jgi:hypothetical protein
MLTLDRMLTIQTNNACSLESFNHPARVRLLYVSMLQGIIVICVSCDVYICVLAADQFL